MTTNYNVFQTTNGWAAKRVDAQRPASVSATQAQAYLAAKTFTSNAGGGDVSVHGRNGQIREKNTIRPASDPRSSKG
jgi:hypothetical protein